MKQVVQDIDSGNTSVREIPDPLPGPAAVLIATRASLISAGTERYVVDLARKSLLAKARARPDHVRRVLQKVKQEGLRATVMQVRAKLDEPMPLGYSAAGVVLECGRGVQEFKPGDWVAAAAPHAGVVSVGRNLCARIPKGVTFEQAAYTSVGAIALEGVRLARVSLGDRVLVIGLGLIGQIAVCLLKAQGCRVFAVDVDEAKTNLARALGADVSGLGAPRDAVMAFSASHGVDAVIITAATASNEPIEFAADVARQKGRIVLVGVVGLNLPRPPFFEKELEFTVSASLGPGRRDPSYEEKGIDYPIGHARWTAQRNMEAVLDLMAAGKLPVERLTTHRLPIERAAEAYDLIAGHEPVIGLLVEYPQSHNRRRVDFVARPKKEGAIGISFIGAGNFARLVLMPAVASVPHVALRGICTAKGLNAEHTGRKYEFDFATTEVGQLLEDSATDVVFIATRHNLHAEFVIAALRAGKHVFVEKPLCISAEELDKIGAVVAELADACPILMTGFNRRFADATTRLRNHFKNITPLSISVRFARGLLPPQAWPQDEDIGGGRIVGEACHAIDLCSAIADSVPVKVYAESVAKVDGIETADDRVFITLRHQNGSISSVSYQAGGDRAAPTERIEAYGGGRTAIVEGWDVIELWSHNRCERGRGGKDKGHTSEIREFLTACRTGGSWPIPWTQIHGTTWASLAAVESLRHGYPVHLGDEDEV